MINLRLIKLRLLPIIIFLIISVTASTQNLDASFTPNIKSPGTILAVKTQSDGKIVVGGKFFEVNGLTCSNIIRLNSNGSLDAEFQSKIGLGAGNTVHTIEIQGDGKILLGGDFLFFNGSPVGRFIRLNPDGSVDEAFLKNLGVGANVSVRSIAIQSDNKIILVGLFTSFNRKNADRIIRINSDGTSDEAFMNTIGTGADFFMNTVAIQPNGKILVGGEFTKFNQIGINRVARLNIDGTLDNTFAPGSGANDFVRVIKLQSDGKIILGGEFSSFAGNGSRRYLVRLNSNGGIDNTFTPSLNNYVYTIAVQSDNKILAGGIFSNVNAQATNYFVRLNTNDGQTDAGFKNNLGTSTNRTVWSILSLTNNQSIIGGDFDKFNGIDTGLMMLNVDGTRNNNLNTVAFAKAMLILSVTEANGKIIVAGDSVAKVNGVDVNGIFALNADGSLDTDFKSKIGSGANGIVRTLSAQPDGKLLVGGEFTRLNGLSLGRIARLNSNWTLDNTFLTNIGSGANSNVRAIALQPDGKILLGGAFTSFNGPAIGRLLRLNNNGTPDTDFNNELGTGVENNTVNSIAIQGSRARIIVGGSFSVFNGELNRRIFRLQSEGTTNTNFLTSGADNTIDFVYVLSDETIVVTGIFRSFNGFSKNIIVKLNETAGLDDDFKLNLEANATTSVGENAELFISTIGSQIIGGEEKILLGGIFGDQISFRRFVLRLNSDGTIDESFDIGGLNVFNFVRVFALKNQDILIAGDFPGTLIRFKTPNPPVAPTNLRASTLFGDEIELSWKWNSTEPNVFFQVQRSINSGSGFETIALTQVGDTSFMDKNININTQYFYRVRAIKSGNASIYSNEVSIIISPLITDLSEKAFQSALTIYPNPNSGEFNLDLSQISTKFTEGLSLTLFNQLGKNVWEKEIDFEENKKIDISHLPSGVYFLRVKNRQNQSVKKIIKY